ncbi:MAG: hypothetical protein IH978_03650 [Nitrospinae bacterium]|nr:hypothetical protein [Nitrospinota bacterium]
MVGKGALGTWRVLGSIRALHRSTAALKWERAHGQTAGGRGVGESALEPRFLRAGRWGKAKVRTGLGKTDRPGS